MSAPTASILIVNYDSHEPLRACLASLRADPAYDRYQVIVVDNASPSGPPAFLAMDYPEVCLLQAGRNLGFGAAANLAAASAAAETLAFLNPDTVVAPGWLEALRAGLAARPDAGLAGARVLLAADPARVNAAGNDMHLTGLTLCRGLGEPRARYDLPAELTAVSGAAFAIRRDVFAALDGFDPAFFLYYEDSDLSLRARLAGWRCLYVPEAIVYHDYTLRFGPDKTFHQERNRYRSLLKIWRWRTLALLTPALLLAELITWGFSLTRDRDHWRNKPRAYLAVLRAWPDVMAARRRAQATRRARDRDLLRPLTTRLAFEQTGDRLAARLAHRVFDPAFAGLRALLLLVIRW